MKPVVEAAIGILADARGRVLVAQRPAGKIAAGKWEFPGGKIESGESSLQALRRELKEELDVDIADGTCLVQHVNEFPDRVVHLDVWLIRSWNGSVRGMEDQPLRWLPPDEVLALDCLPGCEVIVPALVAALGGCRNS